MCMYWYIQEIMSFYIFKNIRKKGNKPFWFPSKKNKLASSIKSLNCYEIDSTIYVGSIYID